jgi:glycolate oxidase iron-sulfur subunit
MARRTIDAFEAAGVDTIAINAAGCGSTMKEYGHLLRDDAEYADRAAAFSGRCRDVSEILAASPPRAPRHALPLRVAYHDACHLQHAQGIKLQPRQVLATIPGVEVVEVPESAVCCGSAGIYNLVEPQAARELGERKARHVASTAPDAVVSSNPGCLLQISAAMEDLGKRVPTYHMVELLDASIRNTPLPR